MLLQGHLSKNRSVYGQCRHSKFLINIRIISHNKLTATNEGEAFYSFVFSTVIFKLSSYLLPLESLLPLSLQRNYVIKEYSITSGQRSKIKVQPGTLLKTGLYRRC